MNYSVAITTHNNREVITPKHRSITEVVVHEDFSGNVFDAKLEAVKKCKGEWVLLLDSDDRFEDSFFEKVGRLKRNNNTLYCPELLGAYDFSEYSDELYDIDNIDKHLEAVNFTAFMVCGSYFFHRQTYIDAAEWAGKLYRADCFYLKYLWLICGGSIEIVKGLQYEHLTQPDGTWYQYENEIWAEIPKLKSKLKELKTAISS